MAFPSTKSSSSPSPAQPQNLNSNRPNSNPRSSEVSNPIRRSFSGNPFSKPSIVANPSSRGFNPVTPANSPSEYTRRISVGRESLPCMPEYDDKENGKDQTMKPARLKSPGLTKGVKHFMSPTISAASKINASPKKKILTDRNEQIRTSVVSLSDLRSSCSSLSLSETLEESNSIVDVGQERVKPEVSHDSMVTHVEHTDVNQEASSTLKGLNKRVAFDANVQTIPPYDPEMPDCVNLDKDDKLIPVPQSPSILLAPLDADPLMPPYDPKTNYLSPRPQFLHYKPSPRVKHFLSYEGDGNPLDDNFNIDGLSDTEVTEENLSDASQKEAGDGSSGEKESPNESEGGTLSEKAKEADTCVDVSEDKEPDATPNAIVTLDMAQGTVPLKEVSRSRLFTKKNCISLLLILLVSCVAMQGVNSPVIRSYHIKSSNIGKLLETSGIAENVRENFDVLAQYFWPWYSDSVSYLSELIQNLKGKEAPLSALSFYNLTALQEDLWTEKYVYDGLTKSGYSMIDHGKSSEQTEAAPAEEEQAEIQADHGGQVAQGRPDEPENLLEEVSDETNNAELEEYKLCSDVVEPEFREEEPTQDTASVSNSDIGSDKEHKLDPFPVEMGASDSADFQGENHPYAVDESQACQMSGVGLENAGDVNEATSQVEMRALDSADFQGGNHPYAVDESEAYQVLAVGPGNAGDVNEAMNSDSLLTETLTSITVPESESSSPLFVTLGLALAVVILTVAAVLVYVIKSSHSKSVPTPEEKAWAMKKLNTSPISENVQDTMWQRLNLPNCVTEVDKEGESCPSEMSRFQRNSSHSHGLKEENEAQSHEKRQKKNYRRESLASSSSEFSMDSPSYGSFTTYEKIPCKHRNGEEDVIITPIRRSSRLRKQVTSP